MQTVATRAFTSRKTLQRVEAGDHGVSIGIYASVLNVPGLLDGLAILADLLECSDCRSLALVKLWRKLARQSLRGEKCLKLLARIGGKLNAWRAFLNMLIQ
ncbi:MAG: hypothetical protein AB8B64_09740 [Granulosicoccus sp.]